jgi:Tol biopolymer transport system component
MDARPADDLIHKPENSRVGRHTLWRIDAADPKNTQPLPIAEDASYSLTVSRSGDKLVYSRETANIKIWGAEINSSRRGQQVNFRPWISSTAMDENPQFSPDGQRIAFQSSRNGKTDIWVANRDGSSTHQLTNLAGTISGFPRWSPDGRSIIFHSRPHGLAGLYVVSVDGGTPVALTGPDGNNETPCWSHDGKWIYFVSMRSGKPRLYKMPSSGGPPTQLSNRDAFFPLESKNGRDLYFITLPEFELWKTTREGNAETKLITDLAPEPAFAPAENGIYYIRRAKPKGNEELVFFRYSTREAERITAIAGNAAMGVAISPDERLLLFSQIDQDDSDLMLINQFR